MKSLKAHDTQGLAAAKQVELDCMVTVLRTRRSDYVQSGAFERENQEENRQEWIIEKI